MPLDVFLKLLSEEGHFSFSYNPKHINSAKKITLNCKNKSVRYVLNQVFTGTVSYKNKGNHVIITGRQEPKASSEQKQPKYFKVTGYVIDKSTSARLSEVSVYDAKTLNSTISDDFGYFTIQLPYNSPEIVLKVEKMGYKDSSILITEKSYQSLEVAINPDLPVEIEVNVPNEDTITTVADTSHKVTTVMFQEGDTVTKVPVEQYSDLWMIVNKKLKAHLQNISDPLFRKAQISVLPAVSTNRLISGNVVNDYSFNLLIGYSKGVRVLEMGGLANIDRGDVGRCQLAGLFNIVGGKVNGFQAGGLMNINRDTMQGAQAAGLMNVNWRHTHGCQMAGLANHTRSIKGAQLACLYNLGLNVDGVQVAGLFNTAIKVKGAQIAGLFNIADEVDGLQVSSLFNVARKIKGVQIGFLNIADSSSGIPIGFLSIVRDGYHKIEVSTDEVMRYNLALRMGVQKFHNIFGVSSTLMDGDKFAWSYTYGVGTSIKLAKKLFLDLDLQSSQLNASTHANYLSMNNRINIGLDWQFAKNVSLAFGPSFNTYVVDSRLYDENSFYQNVGKGYPSLTFSAPGSFIDTKSWIGWKAAIRFL